MNTDSKEKNNVIKAHMLMCFLVAIWGFDYVPAKWGIEVMPAVVVLFFKCALGILVMAVIKIASGDRRFIRLKDVPMFAVTAVSGELLYNFCELNAMNYLPVSLITIVLAFVPAVSIMIERIFFGRRANTKIVVGIITCIIGVALIVGMDIDELASGRGFGYLLAVGAVMLWNIYNFTTEFLGEYDNCTLAMTQMLFAVIMIFPFALRQMPSADVLLSPKIIFAFLWIGVIDAGVGFLIYIFGLQKLGPTATSLYSNFLPVTSTFFGAVFLKESICALQIVGGIIVIASGFIVIKEKGRLESDRLNK